LTPTQFLLKYGKLHQPLGGVAFPTFQQDAEFNWDFIVSNVTKEGWYLAGFFEQVKSRDFLTLTIQNSHEENQIHRSSDHCDLKRTGTRPESIGHLPKTRHQRCDILQLEEQIRRDER